MIIDCHCHAGRGDGFTGPWDTAAPLDRYLPRARRAGIRRTALIPVFHSDYRVANRALGRIVRSHPHRFYGWAAVHAKRDRGRIADLVRDAVSWGAIGIKVHRHDAPITREVCEAARSSCLPILYDVTGEVPSVELAAEEYPDVRFVVPHLGSFGDDWRAQTRLIPVLEHLPNVAADSSGVRRFDVLERAVERAGAHKLLFGSDGPWLHPGLELAKIRALGLAPADERLILGGNFLRLTRRTRRARG